MELEDVTSNYDRAAKHYDLWTEVVFGRLLRVEYLRRETIDLLGDLRGMTVLDIGCGTGRNFPILVPRVGDRGRIVGLDYSQGMLGKARERVRREGWSNVELLRGDAVTLEGVAGPVDAVVSIWCLGIVYDLEAALDRVVEILRPGGRTAIMDFGRSRPDAGLLRWLYPVYSRLLTWAGIDSPEDLDDARLRRRWEGGRAVLRERLQGFRETTYLNGGGLILCGTKPERAG